MTAKLKHSIQALFLLFLVLGTIWVITDSRTLAPYKEYEGEIFGTTFHITYQSREDLHSGILQSLNKVDESLSTFNSKSTISLINSNKSQATDPLFRKVFTQAQLTAQQTGGAFDITVAPLVNAWGFGFKNRVNISQKLIDSLRQFVGYQKVKLQNDKVIKADSRVMLDCSGIAKGFGSDQVASYLENNKVENYMIEIGGEIHARGVNPKGHLWTIGIVQPKDNNQTADNTVQSVLNIDNMSLATSGNYRNFYYKGGRKYAHTIDPHTGYPVQHSILSSTVIAPTCTQADAYATAFMVLGLQKAKKVLANHKELSAYFIYTDSLGKDKIWYSPSLKAHVLHE